MGLVAALLIAVFATVTSCGPKAGDNGNETLAELEEGFANPPREARPYVWWHWMNGNITKDGIRKDLLWMDSIGIGGFHHFDAGIGVAPIVENRMVYMHDDWKDAFKYAIALGDSLGMEMTVASSPGWSCMGGPWVSPEDAMKKLVWREMSLKGGTSYSGNLPEPFKGPGNFQNMGRGTDEYYQDIAVLAVKEPDSYRPLAEMDVKVTSSGGDFSLEQLSNDDFSDAKVLPEGESGYAPVQAEYEPRTAGVHGTAERSELEIRSPACDNRPDENLREQGGIHPQAERERL